VLVTAGLKIGQCTYNFLQCTFNEILEFQNSLLSLGGAA
jgi:hypothetical protein